MQQHDPYEHILKELSDINDADSDILLRESLRKSQSYVESLRIAYKNSPSNVDFSDENLRAAYLLAYYPLHMGILYEILGTLPEDKLNNLFDYQKNRACFVGAGPAPEVIGWISFLKDYYPDSECAMAYIFDKYVDRWHKGLEITRYHLAPNYWDNKLIMCPFTFDLLEPSKYWNARLERAVRISNFFVMQNCINDLLGSEDELLFGILELFRLSKPGSIFIISDLIIPAVRQFLLKIVSKIEEDEIGQCISNHCDHRLELIPNFSIPQIIKTELLTGENNLIPRKSTRYCYIVLERISDKPDYDEVEIPF